MGSKREVGGNLGRGDCRRSPQPAFIHCRNPSYSGAQQACGHKPGSLVSAFRAPGLGLRAEQGPVQGMSAALPCCAGKWRLHHCGPGHLPALQQWPVPVDPRGRLPQVLLFHLRHWQQQGGLCHCCLDSAPRHLASLFLSTLSPAGATSLDSAFFLWLWGFLS